MHRMAAALLERETLDAAEIKLIIEGKELPAVRSALSGVDPGSGEAQKVLKPEADASPASAKATPPRHKPFLQPQKRQPVGRLFLLPHPQSPHL